MQFLVLVNIYVLTRLHQIGQRSMYFLLIFFVFVKANVYDYKKTEAWCSSMFKSTCPIIYRNKCTEWMHLIRVSWGIIICVSLTENTNKIKTAFLHDWHAKMKPFTEYCKEDYEISIADSCLFF